MHSHDKSNPLNESMVKYAFDFYRENGDVSEDLLMRKFKINRKRAFDIILKVKILRNRFWNDYKKHLENSEL